MVGGHVKPIIRIIIDSNNKNNNDKDNNDNNNDNIPLKGFQLQFLKRWWRKVFNSPWGLPASRNFPSATVMTKT